MIIQLLLRGGSTQETPQDTAPVTWFLCSLNFLPLIPKALSASNLQEPEPKAKAKAKATAKAKAGLPFRSAQFMYPKGST